MDKITVSKTALLEKLSDNLELHQADYKAARKEWVKRCTKALKKAAKQAEETGEIDTAPLQDLPKPVSFVKSYEDAIARLEMHLDTEVDLDDRQFAAWVQDNWDWRGAFIAQTSNYVR